MVVFLTACGLSETKKSSADLNKWVKDDGKVRVLATTAIVEDLVKRIGSDNVKVIAIINGDLDPHSYEVVKGDGEKFTYADVVFANGLMLEHSASMQYQLKHHKNVVFLGDELLKKHPQEIIYVDGQLDPHIWMDLSLWKECIDLVEKKLSQIDPLHKDLYQERAANVRRAFSRMDAQMKERMQKIPEERRYLVTSHDAFNYYVRRYFALPNEDWRVRMKALQGLAPDEQISVLQVKEIVNHVCQYNIEVIFPESNLSQDSLEKVKEACQKRGKKIALAKDTLYGDTLGGRDYLEMLEHNMHVLEENLSGRNSSH